MAGLWEMVNAISKRGILIILDCLAVTAFT